MTKMKKMCLHQWIRPAGPYVEVDGVGNCNVCTTNDENKNCRAYCEITIIISGKEN